MSDQAANTIPAYSVLELHNHHHIIEGKCLSISMSPTEIMDGLANCANHAIFTLEMLMVILVISTSGPRQVVPMWWLKSLPDIISFAIHTEFNKKKTVIQRREVEPHEEKK